MAYPGDATGVNATTPELPPGEITWDEKKRDVARITEMVAECFASRDYIEGRAGFMEKRKPVFTGS